jgi:hypothetical protein
VIDRTPHRSEPSEDNVLTAGEMHLAVGIIVMQLLREVVSRSNMRDYGSLLVVPKNVLPHMYLRLLS